MTVSSVLDSLLPLLTVVVGLAAKVIVQVIRRVSARVDQLPVWQMRLVAGVVVAALTIARHFLPGVELPATLDGWNVDAVAAVLSFLVAHFTHQAEHEKSSPPVSGS